MRTICFLISVIALAVVSVTSASRATQVAAIEKQGYLGSPLVEVTPFVFKDRLYRLENNQKFWDVEGASPGARFHEDEVRIRDVQTDEVVSVALTNHAFATALVHDGQLYVFAGDFGLDQGWRQITQISMTRSADLKTWTEPVTVVEAESGELIFNTAVCRGEDRFILLYETNDRRWPAFTFKYCQNTDLDDPAGWKRIDGALYGTEKYVGGPALYWEDGWYYTLYLNAMSSGWETRVTRSRDLRDWQDASVDRPFVTFDPERTGLPLRPDHLRERNASDAELCYFEGQTIIYFTGSDQMVAGDLQWATFDGTPAELLATFFSTEDGTDRIAPVLIAPEGTEHLPAGVPVEALRKYRPSARQLAYQRAQLGAFIHFGPATFVDGDMHATPPAGLFDPVDLDADQWARAAGAFGAEHVVLTAKHHNGFCLWPTSTTQYSIASSPWKGGEGDVVREFVDACRRHDLRPGLYLSGGDEHFRCSSTPEPMGQRHLVGDLNTYSGVFMQQLEELLTGYGPLAVIWFDGAYDPFGWDVMDDDDNRLGTDRGDAIAALVHEHQPDAVIFAGTRPEVRWSGSEQGWASYPLWNVVPEGEGPQHWLGPDDFGYILAEANLHTPSTWFWSADKDHTLLSVERLMQAYDSSIGRGANLLVNMTPDTRGLIPGVEVQRLVDFGEEIRRQFGSPIARTDSGAGWAEEGTLELDLGLEQSVDRVVIEEDLEQGQRVASFGIDVRSGGQWRPVASGQSIGRRLTLRFDPVQTDRIRLRITRSVEVPVIGTFSAFRKAP
jgi:alpha-L-fucosidase